MRFARVYTPWLLVIAVVWNPFARSVAQELPSATPPMDCGASSLYTLLRIHGRTADLKGLARSLSPRGPEGYSMKQLRDEARTRGVPLKGVPLKTGESLDGPSIVLFGDGGHGHYVVVGPVGHTGMLVQVLDPNRMPEVMDREQFEARPRWTGLALVPDRPNWAGWAAVISIAGIFVTLGAVKLRRRSGRRGDLLVGQTQVH